MSDVGCLDYRPTDLHNIAYKRPNTRIGALYEVLVSGTRCAGKVDDDISQIQHSLDGQADTFSKLNPSQPSVHNRLDGFTTAHTQA